MFDLARYLVGTSRYWRVNRFRIELSMEFNFPCAVHARSTSSSQCHGVREDHSPISASLVVRCSSYIRSG